MVFPSEQEQIEKFEKDHVAQHYFEVLRTLISKKWDLYGAFCYGTFQEFASRCQDPNFL